MFSSVDVYNAFKLKQLSFKIKTKQQKNSLITFNLKHKNILLLLT